MQSPTLAKFFCHKTVLAAEISNIVGLPDGSALISLNHDGAIEVPTEYITKHSPQVGGYYVEYEDGYRSFSPAAAFEAGYKDQASEIERIAKAAHEINLAYCQALGDTSQPGWEDAPDWQRKSAINGVTFHLENPNTTPEQSHENWLQEKIEDGWTYGKVKDPEAKTHPCFLSYDLLPVVHKAKDHLFRQVVKSFTS